MPQLSEVPTRCASKLDGGVKLGLPLTGFQRNIPRKQPTGRSVNCRHYGKGFFRPLVKERLNDVGNDA